MKPEIKVSRRFTIEQCRINFDSLFVFSDNLERVGMGNQAIIREQSNSVGLATKLKPTMEKDAFFSDDDFEENCKLIDEEIEKINKYAEEKGYRNIVLPYMGLGTGLAQMPLRAIRTFSYLCLRLSQAWEYNNLEGQFTLKN